MPKVTFYFDVISPFSYFAYAILKRYAQPWKLDISMRPVFLGGVMQASGNRPPAEIPNKGKHMFDYDLPHFSKYIGVPYKYPAQFPVNTVHIIRFLRIVQDKAPQKLDPLATLFFEQMWGVNGDAVAAAKPAAWYKLIPGSLMDRAQLEEFITLAGSTENKDRLKSEAAQLVAEGAFGFPWFVVTREDGQVAKFFGSDRFELMAFFLGMPYKGPFPEGSAAHL